MTDGVRVVNEFIVKPGRSLVLNYIDNNQTFNINDFNANGFPEDSILCHSGNLRYIGNDGKAQNFIPSNIFKEKSIVNSLFADGAVDSRSIANSAIQTKHLESLAVTAEKIASNAITTDKLANNAITADKIASETLTYNLFSTELKDFLTIKDGSITKPKLEEKVRNIIDNAIVKDIPNNTTAIPTDLNVTGNITAKNVYAERCYNPVYADIAEAYKCDKKLEPGTIVSYKCGKVEEANKIDSFCIGVISDEYANLFGASQEDIELGKYVAVGLVGKIHVKVIGKVHVGDYIIPMTNGIGVASKNNRNNAIGRALENKTTYSDGKVLCLIK